MEEITNIFTKNKNWGQVLYILQRLNQNGYKAYLAGGCVRDAFLARPSSDFDIATDARPEVVEALFENTIPVGKAFGVIVVVVYWSSFEVATFRVDKSYQDGRRPEVVVFCTPEEDASRRDFTINAMFFDVQSAQVLDFFSGVSDLRQKRIRTVGNPDLRFSEDHLRLLRAIRFAAQLNFFIEPDTFCGLQKHAYKLRKVSRERVFNESYKLFMSAFPAYGLHLLEASQLLPFVFPESWEVSSERFCEFKYYCLNVFEPYRWPAFLSLLAVALQDFQPLEREGLKSLRGYTNNRKELKFVENVLNSWKVFLSSSRDGELLEALDREEGVVGLALLELMGHKSEKECNSLRALFLSVAGRDGHLPPPAINGHNLIEAGYTPGPEMAQKLKSLYWQQLEESARVSGGVFGV